MRAHTTSSGGLALAALGCLLIAGCASFDRLDRNDPTVDEEEVFEAGRSGGAAERLDNFHHVLDHHTEYDPEVVAAALSSAGEIGDPASVAHIAPLSRDSDEEIRWHVAAALREIDSDDARALRVRMAQGDASELVRDEAAR